MTGISLIKIVHFAPNRYYFKQCIIFTKDNAFQERVQTRIEYLETIEIKSEVVQALVGLARFYKVNRIHGMTSCNAREVFQDGSEVCLVFPLHFPRVLPRHSVFYYCLETHAILFL